MTEPVRLSKRVVALAQCSRREAEQYIEGGWVRVDGEVEERPQFMVAEQHVSIDPQARLSPIAPVSILLNLAEARPAELGQADIEALLAPENRWEGDFSGVRPLRRHRQQLGMPQPLPPGGTGLVVCSQDARILRMLNDQQQPVEQEFLVDIRGQLDDKGLALLNHGLRINHYALPPAKVSRQSEQRLRFAFKRLQADRIGMMCQAVGVQATSLKRLRIGRQSLSKLPPGRWRYLAPFERF